MALKPNIPLTAEEQAKADLRKAELQAKLAAGVSAIGVHDEATPKKANVKSYLDSQGWYWIGLDFSNPSNVLSSGGKAIMTHPLCQMKVKSAQVQVSSRLLGDADPFKIVPDPKAQASIDDITRRLSALKPDQLSDVSALLDTFDEEN